MKLLQTLVLRLVSVGMVAGGAALILIRFSSLYQTAIDVVPDSAPLRIGVGAVFFLVGVFGCLPSSLWSRKSKVIAFPGPHGDLVIQLGSVGASLSRAVGKLSEVRKVSVDVQPLENNQKARIAADVWLRVAPGAGARTAGDRVREYIEEKAKNILGDEVVVSVDLNIVKILTDKEREPERVYAPEPTASYEDEAETSAEEPAAESALDTLPEELDEEAGMEEEDEPLPGLPLRSSQEPEVEDTPESEEEPRSTAFDDLAGGGENDEPEEESPTLS